MHTYDVSLCIYAPMPSLGSLSAVTADGGFFLSFLFSFLFSGFSEDISGRLMKRCLQAESPVRLYIPSVGIVLDERHRAHGTLRISYQRILGKILICGEEGEQGATLPRVR